MRCKLHSKITRKFVAERSILAFIFKAVKGLELKLFNLMSVISFSTSRSKTVRLPSEIRRHCEEREVRETDALQPGIPESSSLSTEFLSVGIS